MKITGFKLLGGGVRGIEVDGYELIGIQGMGASFNDKVKRTRNFPLTHINRDAIAALRYPVLVGTQHWRSEYAEYMVHDFSGIKKERCINEQVGKELMKMWESTQIERVSSDKGTYKIHAKILSPIAVMNVVIVIEPDNEYSLYTLVSEILQKVVGLIDQTLNLPKLAYSDKGEIRQLIREISSDDADELGDDVTDDDAFMAIMSTAGRKKGYSVVMDSNLLTQLAEAHTEDLRAIGEPEEEEAVLRSSTTMDKSIFNEPEDTPE